MEYYNDENKLENDEDKDPFNNMNDYEFDELMEILEEDEEDEDNN